ncbi:MAG TPA: rhomboid family intramembrane serine protease [Micromonosporaceae bacterium]
MTAEVGPGAQDSSRFGTQAFYAAIGRAFVVMCTVVPVLALIEFIDQRLGGAIDLMVGIRPRQVSGLDGILLAPLVHDGYPHLLANSAPLILLGTFVLASGTRRFLLATLVIAVISGLGVWFLTDPRYLVIGASGIIFGWLGFLLMRGIVERSLWNFAVALIVGLLYGWQLVTLLPTDARVSWQGHLFGFIGGIVAAVIFRRRRVEPTRPAEVGQVGQPGDG